MTTSCKGTRRKLPRVFTLVRREVADANAPCAVHPLHVFDPELADLLDAGTDKRAQQRGPIGGIDSLAVWPIAVGVQAARIKSVEFPQLVRPAVLRSPPALRAGHLDALERVDAEVLDHLLHAVPNQRRKKAEAVLYGALRKLPGDEAVSILPGMPLRDVLHRERPVKFTELHDGRLDSVHRAVTRLLSFPVFEQVQHRRTLRSAGLGRWRSHRRASERQAACGRDGHYGAAWWQRHETHGGRVCRSLATQLRHLQFELGHLHCQANLRSLQPVRLE